MEHKEEMVRPSGEVLNNKTVKHEDPNVGSSNRTNLLSDRGSTLINETLDQSENDDWLHRNVSYHPSTQISEWVTSLQTLALWVTELNSSVLAPIGFFVTK
ncbi:unnamed protein product [Urochloa humidicola]